MSQVISNFLKTKYDKGTIPREYFNNFPTLARIPKRSDGTGDSFVTSVITGKPTSVASTLSIAEAGYTAGSTNLDTKGAKWTCPWGQLVGVVRIDDFRIKQSKSDEGAFLRWLSEQVDGLKFSFLEHLSMQLFAEPNRGLALVTTAGTDTGVMTLSNPSDIVKIQVGDRLDAAASATATTIANSATLYVIAKNQNTGTITVSHTATGTSGTGAFAGSGLSTSTPYYVCNVGEWGLLATPNQTFYGLGDWIPATDPAATAFCGMDRTSDITGLSGFRYTPANLTSMGIRQRITGLLTVMNSRGTCQSGGGVTDIILNPEKWQQLVDEMSAQGYRPLDGGTAEYGYSSIKWSVAGTTVDVVSDRHCPIGTCYALTMPKDGRNIVMTSVDQCPHVMQEDGLMMVRVPGALTYQHILLAYPTFTIKAPGWCGRVAV